MRPSTSDRYFERIERVVDALLAAPAEAHNVDSLAAFVNGGGEVLFGTDVGYMRDFDPADEYALMTQAGMTPMQILASLTTAPAARFHAQLKLGRVAVGYKADLAVLAGDPATDIRVFAHVRYTLRDGHVIYDAGAQPLP
jgi:imidazolonepropionase-like amidohydrolase